MVCRLLVQICLEWNYSLHKGQWSSLLQIWLWLVNNGVLWNMVFLEWSRKESKNQLSGQTKIRQFCCHQYVKNDEIVIFAVAKLSWSTVCILAFKTKTSVLFLHTRCIKSVSGNFNVFFFYFNYCRVYRVYVFVKNVEICKRCEGA